MRNFSKQDIEDAKGSAQSYEEFKSFLEAKGNRVPQSAKPPLGMTNWIRRLRYEVSKDTSFGTPTTGHDIRQARYYKRLEELGCPEPLVHMG